MKQLTKARSERIHFKNRVRQRYGIDINRHAYFYLLDQIKNKESECVLIQSNTRTVHRVTLPCEYYESQLVTEPQDRNGLTLLVIYDKSRGEIITALPQNINVKQIKRGIKSDGYYECNEQI